MFNVIKTKLTDEHHRSKEELGKFLEKELEEIGEGENDVMVEMDKNEKEKSRMVGMLEKI